MEHSPRKYKDIIQHLADLRTVHLSELERSAIWGGLEIRMSHTVTFPSASRLLSSGEGIPSPFSRIKDIANKRMGTIAVIMMFSLTGSVVAAAEGALPGDFLYPVKVHVNEKVESLASASMEAKANWEIELATRRLDEALALKASGELSAETRGELEAEAKDHAKVAEGFIAELRVAGKMGAALEAEAKLSKLEVKFESLLDANAEIRSEGEDREVQITVPLLGGVNGDIGVGANVESSVALGVGAGSDAHAESTTTATTLDTALKLASTTKATLQAIAKAYAENKASLSAAVKASIEARLSGAKESFVLGEIKIKAKNTLGAIADFKASLEESAAAELLLEQALKVKLELDSLINLNFNSSSGNGGSTSPQESSGGESSNGAPNEAVLGVEADVSGELGGSLEADAEVGAGAEVLSNERSSNSGVSVDASESGSTSVAAPSVTVGGVQWGATGLSI